MEKEQRELEERVKRIMQSLVNKYGILGLVKIKGIEQEVPIINFPMMSDERWQQLAEEQSRKHYGTKENLKTVEQQVNTVQ